MSRIQIVARHGNGCDYFRCILPAIYLQKDVEWCKSNSIKMLWIANEEYKIDCDILIYNKLIATPISKLKQLQSQGMKIIVDIDDHWILPISHAHYQGWMTKTIEGQQYTNAELTEQHIRNADVVTCTSLRLQEIIRPLNKNTVVIPNALPFSEGIYQPGIREPHDKTVFLYAGGVSHLPDVQLLSGKFQRIGSDSLMKSQAEFVIAGYEKVQQRLYHTKDDYQQQNKNFVMKDVSGPYDHMVNIFKSTGCHKVLPTQPVTKYLSCYDTADVSLVPLVNNSWNSYKSVLKLLEAGCKKLPVICSAVAPYTDVVEFEQEGVMMVRHPDDWLKYIKYCIKNKNFVQDQGQKLYDWTSEQYSLYKWNNTRKQLFSNLIK